MSSVVDGVHEETVETADGAPIDCVDDDEDTELQAVSCLPVNAFVTGTTQMFHLATSEAKTRFSVFLEHEPMPAVVVFHRNGRTRTCTQHSHACRHVSAVESAFDVPPAIPVIMGNGDTGVARLQAQRALSYMPIPFRLSSDHSRVRVESVTELRCEVPKVSASSVSGS